MTVTEPILVVRDVSKRYYRGSVFDRKTRVDAVQGVSLTISSGRCLALAGPSGSGKSTLARLILGLEQPDQGTIHFRGCPTGKWTDREARRAVQAVFQNSPGAVNPRFNAREIVGEPLRNFFGLRGTALRDRVAELMHEVGLDPADMEKYPHQWSGGELQRLCIARALAPDPALLVLDEAVSSLDMLNAAKILALLQKIRRERDTAFLFVTHDMRVVAAIADSLAVMEEGRIVHSLESLDEADVMTASQPRGLYRDLLLAVPPAGFEPWAGDMKERNAP